MVGKIALNIVLPLHSCGLGRAAWAIERKCINLTGFFRNFIRISGWSKQTFFIMLQITALPPLGRQRPEYVYVCVFKNMCIISAPSTTISKSETKSLTSHLGAESVSTRRLVSHKSPTKKFLGYIYLLARFQNNSSEGSLKTHIYVRSFRPLYSLLNSPIHSIFSKIL